MQAPRVKSFSPSGFSREQLFDRPSPCCIAVAIELSHGLHRAVKTCIVVSIKGREMSRIGRPREFDRDHALQRAMELFWAQGYEGTTLADLQKAMGGIT